jgi:hypothetical protein
LTEVLFHSTLQVTYVLYRSLVEGLFDCWKQCRAFVCSLFSVNAAEVTVFALYEGIFWVLF